MKAGRRHELQTNLLADWLAKNIEALKPYANAILAALVLVVVIGASLAWWVHHSRAASAQGWDEFYQALSRDAWSPSEFDDLIERYPGTDLACWAATMAGDLHLNAGCNLLFVNKASANQELRKAVEYYQLVLQQSDKSSLRERATFGLARALEAQGDLDQAVKDYQQVARQWPDGAYAKLAGQRAEELALPATREWYDRFAKFDPKPAYTNEPGTPGERPPFDLKSLPEEGPLFQPRIMPELEQKGTEEGKPETP